jgi:hypothetical protein
MDKKETELNQLFFERMYENNFPNECPEDCKFLLVTKDVFSTGDSPTEYECECYVRTNCPLYTGD